MAMDAGLGTRSEINITPMIDVLLVLVIIFMLMLNRHVMFAQLARDGSSSSSNITERIVLELKDDGTYAINTQPVAWDRLSAELREIYAPRIDKMLLIKSGPQRTYAEAIAAMDVAKGAGVEVVALMP